LRHGTLRHRPDGLAREAVEDVEPALLAGLCHQLARLAVDGRVDDERRADGVVVPDRVMHELEVPPLLSRLQIDGHGLGVGLLRAV
jgi:hypothetical protein